VIPFLDLNAAYSELATEIDQAVARVLTSGWYIGGEEVAAFEEDFARYVEAKHCVGAANGLDALILSLRACGIEPGDQVIVPSNTYIATWLAVSVVSAIPVPVEPNATTHNIDTSQIENAITERTRAILPVHLYGQPADLDPILAIAQKYDLRVIEDAAQAHGARYKGRRLGAHSDVVCWSFYPGKNLGGMGDGGAVTTDNLDLAERVRMLGNYGSSRKYVHNVKGVNSRLDPLQAAVLGIKLAHLDVWNNRRRRIASRYTERLAETSLILPQVPEWAEPVWHLYVVRSLERDALQQRLSDNGIGTLIHYPVPPHMQGAYSDAGIPPDALPLAQKLAREVLSLPMGPHLSQKDLQTIIQSIASF
jgi:dTDP-4-amino-4,6-dideoxygalactose transaminase